MNTVHATQVETPAQTDTQFLPRQDKAARKLATVDRRLVAFVVDGLFLAVLGGLTGAIGGLVNSETWVAFWSMLVPALVGIIYYVRPYSTTGQTWGKRLLGIRVVSIDGSPLTLGKGILRWLGYFVSGLPLDLGYLWAIWDKDKQTWHDKIAGTIVVKE
jgi:uncharacterized RDD family membrane protein YckC